MTFGTAEFGSLEFGAVPTTGPVNDSLAVPFIASAATLFAPTIANQSNTLLLLPLLPSTETTAAPTLAPQSNDSLLVPLLGSGAVTFAPPLLSAQNNTILTVPQISATSVVSIPTLFAQPNQPFVVSSIVPTAVLFSPLLSGNLVFNVPLLVNTTTLFPVNLVIPGIVTLSVPKIVPVSTVHVPQLIDAALTFALTNAELNPFEPNVPASLQDVLPFEGFNYLQNLAESLHDTYGKLQSGNVALPAKVLQFTDKKPQFQPGTEAKFLHEKLGFISGTYRKFADGVKAGAPVALSRFDPDSVTGDFTSARDGTLLGIAAPIVAPNKGEFGWVITKGRNLLPIKTDTTVEPGDEIQWSNSGAVGIGLDSPVLARYVGNVPLLSGIDIPGGSLEIDIQSTIGNKFISQFADINSQITFINSVSAGQAQTIIDLQAASVANAAAIQSVSTVRADAETALARTVQNLGVTLEGRIVGEIAIIRQAFVDADSTVVSLIEKARSEFKSLTNPLQLAIADAQSKITLLTADGESVAKAISEVSATQSLDPLNLFPDPNFAKDTGVWESQATAHVLVAPPVGPFGKVVEMTGTAAVNDSIITTIQVLGGETLFLEFNGLKDAFVNVGAEMGIVIEYLDSADVLVLADSLLVLDTQLNVTTWTKITESQTVPATAVTARLVLTNRATHTAGLSYLAAPRLFRFEAGADVTANAAAFTTLEGRVTTDEGLITANANATTAVQAQVDAGLQSSGILKPGVHALSLLNDLFASSITFTGGETVDSLKPAEAGADKTETRSQHPFNTTFEAGAEGWPSLTGWVIANDPANARQGNWVASYAGTTAALRNQFISNVPGGMPAEPGDRFMVGGWVKTTAGAAFSRAGWRVSWRNSAGTEIDSAGTTSTSSPPASLNAANTTYTQVRAIVTAPANTAFAVLEGVVFSRTAGTIYIDDGFLFPMPRDADIDALKTTNGPAEAGADATATATAFTTLNAQVQTVDGKVATTQAQWGVVVDVNNRVTGAVKLDATLTESTFDILADKFRVFNGTVDTPVFAVAGGKVTINGVPLNPSVLKDQGDGVLRPIGIGIGDLEVFDGVPVVFGTPWSVIPTAIFHSGGVVNDPALTGIYQRVDRALNPSVTGLTPSLKLSQISGVQTSVTDSTVDTNVFIPNKSIEKSATLEALDDTYTFRYSYTGIGILALIDFYTRTILGGAWTQRGTATHSQDGTFTKQITVDGLGVDAAFGFQNDETISGSILTVINVKYTTQAGVVQVSATPTGAQGVKLTVIGNVGSV